MVHIEQQQSMDLPDGRRYLIARNISALTLLVVALSSICNIQEETNALTSISQIEPSEAFGLMRIWIWCGVGGAAVARD